MKFFQKKRIFLDYASITPVDKRVSDCMRKYQSETFANPSALYTEALKAKSVMEKAREKVAEVLNSQKKEIILPLLMRLL